MNRLPKATHSACTNPYIPKSDGDPAVQAYISAMLGWKQAVGRQIDTTVEAAFPDVRKKVRWNTPFYGKADGWFLTIYYYKAYVQIGFLTGSALDPLPPKASKHARMRYLDIHEDETLDTEQLTRWVHQALAQPGEVI